MIWKLIFIGIGLLVAFWAVLNYVKTNGWIDIIAWTFIVASLVILAWITINIMRKKG